jgi:hypothetical protein
MMLDTKMPTVIYEPLATVFGAPPRGIAMTFGWRAASTIRVVKNEEKWFPWVRADGPPTLDEFLAASLGTAAFF